MDDYYIYVPLTASALAIAVLATHAVGLMKRSPGSATMIEVSSAIQAGARAFLRLFYSRLAWLFLVVFAIFFVSGQIWRDSGLRWRASVALLIGMLSSALAIGVAVWFSTHVGARAAESSRTGGIKGALKVALGAGSIASLAGVGFALLGLSAAWSVSSTNRFQFTILAAFAFGSAIAALMARVSGGIHAATCDIGADIVAAGNEGFDQADLRNPATIADQVGDHLSGIAGLIADVMDSIIAAVIAAILAAAFFRLQARAIMLPLLLVSAGLICTLIGFAFIRAFARNDPRRALVNGAWATTVLFVCAAAGITLAIGDIRMPPNVFGIGWFSNAWVIVGRGHILAAVLIGVVAGRLIAISTDYFTAMRYRPAHRVSLASQSGPVLTAIQGQRVGMMSCIFSAVVVGVAILAAHNQAGFFGIVLAAVGVVSTLGMSAALIACDPIADNACAIAEMARLDRSVREITDILDSVGNNISAIGRGLSSGVAALACAAVVTVFAVVAHGRSGPAQVVHVAAGLLIGGAIPYLVAAKISGAVGATASAILDEARRQLAEIPGLAEGKGLPDAAQINEIATRRSIRAALAVTSLVIALPIAVGAIGGMQALAGTIAGALVSGLMLGTQSVNTGSALGHSKKFIEEGLLGGEGSQAHDASRIGDQIGDALKDAIGPAMNMVMKLLAITALLILPLLREWAK